jgi:hypothetical protein
MSPDEITAESVVAIILDADRRAALLEALANEHGWHLPLHNRLWEAAECVATAEELRAITEILRAEPAGEESLGYFVFHPEMPHKLLHELLDAGLCLTELGHRSGPRDLLETLASRHRSSEAITTLALDYYAGPETSDDEFAAFVREYRDDFMLRYNLRRSAKLSPERRAIALAALDSPE